MQSQFRDQNKCTCCRYGELFLALQRRLIICGFQGILCIRNRVRDSEPYNQSIYIAVPPKDLPCPRDASRLENCMDFRHSLGSGVECYGYHCSDLSMYTCAIFLESSHWRHLRLVYQYLELSGLNFCFHHCF